MNAASRAGQDLSLLNDGASELAISLSDKESGRLLTFLDLLSKWNRKHNLTAVPDEQMVTAHLLDSLSILPWLPEGSTLDLGSGAGLPGIPLAIVRPESRFALLDASFKRVVFLREVIRSLGLANVEAMHARVEDVEATSFSASGQGVGSPGTGGFATIVTRGFASLAETVACSNHLLSVPGQWLAMKGRYPTQELGELEVGPGSQVQAATVHELRVPGLAAQRHLVVLHKTL